MSRPLTNATLITIPGAGHFVVPQSECVPEVMAFFLADPAAPDTSCVATLQAPAFTISPP